MDLSAQNLARDIRDAAARIAPYVRTTPLERSPFLSAELHATVLLKEENLQVTASFKARGAFNALLALEDEQRAHGVTTSSTGNHANAMAHAMSELGIPGKIYVPRSIAAVKLQQLRARGAQIEIVDGDPAEAEAVARRQAEREGRTYVSPYNDRNVVAGQGTIGLEILDEVGTCDAVFVPVGGGGLIGGIAGWIRAARPEVKVIGVQPAGSAVMMASVKAGAILRTPYEPSLADAVSGWTEPGSITFPMCRDWVDDWITVEEEEIADAMRTIIELHSMLVEGAGALAVAAARHDPERFRDQLVVCVVSGARVSAATLARVLNREGRL